MNQPFGQKGTKLNDKLFIGNINVAFNDKWLNENNIEHIFVSTQHDILNPKFHM